MADGSSAPPLISSRPLGLLLSVSRVLGLVGIAIAALVLLVRFLLLAIFFVGAVILLLFLIARAGDAAPIRVVNLWEHRKARLICEVMDWCGKNRDIGKVVVVNCGRVRGVGCLHWRGIGFLRGHHAGFLQARAMVFNWKRSNSMLLRAWN
ncbi:hypothetical protein B0T25DRAFT_529518 [Lasiosphaeria hispida]|uniref:Uncharacterized protein n=1 Tax=Lasiosphaeria hispida TaxID=260671 RepID=A0AAJ0HX20_9PEZI|nr:hypothetical protein B0T25DRAFT_529518 [Lasiosphaeria hispida]